MIKKFKSTTEVITKFIYLNHLIAFFVITTALKLILINKNVLNLTWPESDFYNGVLMSVALPSLLFMPLLFIKKHKNLKALILSILISVILLIDLVYYSYFDSIPSIALLSSLKEAAGVTSSITKLLHPSLLLLFIDIPIAIVINLLTKHFFKYDNSNSKGLKITNISLALFIVVCFFLSVRSVGFDKLTRSFNRAYDSKATAQYYSAIGAHVIDTARFIIQETSSLSETEISIIKTWIKDNKPEIFTSKYTGDAKNKNIILIQVESLASYVINQTINNKEITPNLNRLANTSQFFPNVRFIKGAGGTSDTDLVVNTSFFPLDDSSAFVRYGNSNYTSLPKVVNQLGYSTYAYHGFTRNYWNRSQAFKSLGYQKFYASDNFSKGKILNIGLNDETFLSETADYINDQPKPSFSYLITLTSHTPFNITDETKELGINSSNYPDQVGGYLENINYVDRMLGNFFDKLKAYNLYDDSLIIIYGDHTPTLDSFTAGTINYNSDSVNSKEIPIIIKTPGKNEATAYPKTGATIDIMPTILDLIGVKTGLIMFGQSLFVKNSEAMQVCVDQLVSFSNTNCENTLKQEKEIANQIIRYDLFNTVSN